MKDDHAMDLQLLLFAKTHEWLRLDGDVATIGISDFAVQSLTDLVYIELPQPGRVLKAGEVFGEVESVKAASDLYSPVAGTVVESNTKLAEDPAQLSASPYETGWLIRLKVSLPVSRAGLLDAEEYKRLCATESH